MYSFNQQIIVEPLQYDKYSRPWEKQKLTK